MSEKVKSRDGGGEGVDGGRRRLLRKAAYTAPVLMTLGLAGHSQRALAQFPASKPVGTTEEDGLGLDDEDLLKAAEGGGD